MLGLIIFLSLSYLYDLKDQIIGVGYRLKEAEAVTSAVGDSIFWGLLPGAGYTYLGSDLDITLKDNYVHFLPFWLYLKGGIIFVALFYFFLIKVLLMKLSYFKNNVKNISSIFINIGFFLGLISTDFMTNQFASIAGSFFLGFSILFIPKDS